MKKYEVVIGWSYKVEAESSADAKAKAMVRHEFETADPTVLGIYDDEPAETVGMMD
jgi:hypothetical protein